MVMKRNLDPATANLGMVVGPPGAGMSYSGLILEPMGSLAEDVRKFLEEHGPALGYLELGTQDPLLVGKRPDHRWEWCDHCRAEIVVCGTCGNNVCNGGYGRLPKGTHYPDGVECSDCESAYQLWQATPMDPATCRRLVRPEREG